MKTLNDHLEIQITPEFNYKPIPEPILPDARDFVKKALPAMSKNEIESLRSEVKAHYLNRFRRPKTTKYGSLNKGFTESQLNVFLKGIQNIKHRLLFEVMANLGLRIGEAVKVSIKDIDFETREVKIFTEKARQLDSLIIPIPLFRELLEFIKANSAQIEQNEGYVFFREARYSKRAEPYLELNYVRRIFREYVEQANLDETYDVSEESNGRTPRRLHRLTTHSLRHTAITRFSRSTNGNVVLTSRFARHRDISTTSRYISTDKKELYDVIDGLAVSEVALLKKRLCGSGRGYKENIVKR
jgi:integrase